MSKELDKAIKKGVKVVLMDKDIPAWKRKTAVVATNKPQVWRETTAAIERVAGGETEQILTRTATTLYRLDA